MITLIGAHLQATFVVLLRSPGYWVPTLLFPTMLFLFFGVHAGGDSIAASRAVMVSWCCYAVIGVAFYQFGVGIAQDRESAWETYLRVLPAPAMVRISARAIAGAAFAVAAASLVVVIALWLTPATLDLRLLTRLVPALLVGSVPFAFLGIALGYFTSAKSAVWCFWTIRQSINWT